MISNSRPFLSRSTSHTVHLTRALVLAATIGMILAFPTTAQTSLAVNTLNDPSLVATSQETVAGTRMIIDEIALFDGPLSTVEVERFEVLTPDAKVHIKDQDGTYSVDPPSISHWKGKVIGDPDSSVYLAVDELGATKGLIQTGERLFVVGTDTDQQRTVARQVDDTVLREARSQWQCGNDDPEHRNSLAHRAAEEADLAVLLNGAGQTPSAGSIEGLLANAQRAGESYAVEVAVETDYEYYTQFNSQAAASAYVTTLFGGIAAMYSREVSTQLRVSAMYLYPNGANSDPWTATSTINALYELRDYWRANRTGVVRDTVHLLSGKHLGGGVAYLSVLRCSNSAYGMTANIDGDYNPSSPTAVWDFNAVAHELGHNFGSGHTHDSQYYNPPVDNCPTTAPPDGGTIMSYCHLGGRGDNYIKPYFGRVGYYGYQSERVNARILSHLADADNYGCLPDPINEALDFNDDFETGGTSAWN